MNSGCNASFYWLNKLNIICLRHNTTRLRCVLNFLDITLKFCTNYRIFKKNNDPFFVEIKSVLFWNSHNDAQYTYNCNFQNHSYNFLTFISISYMLPKMWGWGVTLLILHWVSWGWPLPNATCLVVLSYSAKQLGDYAPTFSSPQPSWFRRSWHVLP